MVSPLRAIVMLYDGIIQSIGQARQGIETGDIEARFNATQKACKIVLGLQANLDFDQGGDVSVMLDQFYHRVFRDLQQLNFANSAEACDAVIATVSEVRDSWRVLVEQEARNGPAGGAPASAGSAAAPASAPAKKDPQQPAPLPPGGFTLSV